MILSKEELNEIIKSLQSKDVRDVEKSYNACLKLSEDSKKELNNKLIPELHSKDIAYRNLVSEILVDTIKFSPELIKEKYDDPSADFRIHLITVAKGTLDEEIKRFFSEMIYSEPEAKVRLELFDALSFFNDDVKVFEHLVTMFKIETDIAPYILQLLGNFNMPICRNFLFNELLNETNESKISILLYSLSNIDSTQVVLNYLVKDMNRHSVGLQHSFLKGIIKIADKNNLDIPDNEYLRIAAEKLLPPGDAEEAYNYVYLHLGNLSGVSFNYFFAVFNGEEDDLIAKMLFEIKKRDKAFFSELTKAIVSNPMIKIELKSRCLRICEKYSLIN